MLKIRYHLKKKNLKTHNFIINSTLNDVALILLFNLYKLDTISGKAKKFGFRVGGVQSRKLVDIINIDNFHIL